MLGQIMPLLAQDMYKAFHPMAYRSDTEFIYSNFTPRSGKHSNTNLKGIIWVGIQAVVTFLEDSMQKEFFSLSEDEAVKTYVTPINSALGKEIADKHIRALHKLQYLPLEIKALEEGAFVPYGIPAMTVKNTVAGFGWLVNAFEDFFSANLWPICTSATTAFAFRQRFEESVALKDSGLPIKFYGHDFSFRGMMGIDAAAMSGFGHLTSFYGSDTIPAALFAKKYYNADFSKDLVFASVDATEHSVMCSYGTEGELNSLEHLMENISPKGILSVVSDTWDFWKLVAEYLPLLKDKIMAREGTLVIRPDSGGPVKILTGYTIGKIFNDGSLIPGEVYKMGNKYYTGRIVNDEWGDTWLIDRVEVSESEVKGLIEYLWDIFGGTETPSGFKLLDSHIGAIYGDSITLEVQDQIINRLERKGFVPSVVLGIGSYTYQYVTRDTHGFAMKATGIKYAGDTKWTSMQKTPKTDSGSKHSAKGLLHVREFGTELGTIYELVQDVDFATEQHGSLKTVFKNGRIFSNTTLEDIRARIDNQLSR
jgi:nicotinamide phosphoribosyltransferase